MRIDDDHIGVVFYRGRVFFADDKRNANPERKTRKGLFNNEELVSGSQPSVHTTQASGRVASSALATVQLAQHSTVKLAHTPAHAFDHDARGATASGLSFSLRSLRSLRTLALYVNWILVPWWCVAHARPCLALRLSATRANALPQPLCAHQSLRLISSSPVGRSRPRLERDGRNGLRFTRPRRVQETECSPSPRRSSGS